MYSFFDFFFQLFDCDGKFTPPHSYWVMKGSIFDILGMLFFHFLWLNELLSHIENIYQCYFLNLLWLFWTGSYWKSSSIISSVSLPIIISVLSLLECIRRIPLLTIGDMKSIFIVRWNFHEPNYLRSSAI